MFLKKVLLLFFSPRLPAKRNNSIDSNKSQNLPSSTKSKDSHFCNYYQNVTHTSNSPLEATDLQIAYEG